MDSDFRLIQKMKMGDEQAVDEFVRKYYPVISQYCHLHIRDYGYAQDVTQETFERFFRTLGRYKHYGKAVNYLYVIAANACKDYYKKKNEVTMEILPEKPEYVIEDIEQRIDVHTALESLPEELRETAVLFFFQGIRQKEIAEILGIGLPLVKYRVRRAKELLAAYIGEGEEL